MKKYMYGRKAVINWLEEHGFYQMIKNELSGGDILNAWVGSISSKVGEKEHQWMPVIILGTENIQLQLYKDTGEALTEDTDATGFTDKLSDLEFLLTMGESVDELMQGMIEEGINDYIEEFEAE